MAGRLATGFIAAIALMAMVVASASAAESPQPRQGKQTFEALLELEHPFGLNRFVRRVSDPSSRHYRDYASIEQLARRFGASAKSKRAVRAWAQSREGRVELDPTGTYAVARLPLAEAERLAGGRIARKAGATARVPRALRGHVSAISLPSPAPKYRPAAAPSTPASRDSQLPHTGTQQGCAEGRNAGQGGANRAFTPNQYLDAYGHSKLHAKGFRGKGTRFAVLEIDGFKRSDIETFGACFGVRIPPIKLHTIGTGGPLPPGDETTLDLEILSAAAPKAKRIDVYENSGSQLDLLEALAAAIATPKAPPDVISISLGLCEADVTEQLGPTRAMSRVFAAAAGAGISSFVSAGDQGSSACTHRVDDQTTIVPITNVSNPASSPYVTAVGGTNFSLDAQNRIVDEIVWNDAPNQAAAGGGGYSNLFKLPWWQHRVPGAGVGSRIVPDVAALADITPGYAIYCTAEPCRNGDQQSPGWISIGGTSAAAPLTAGAIALINEQERRKGRGHVGHINPLLYDIGRDPRERARTFTDVVSGDNDLGTMFTPPVSNGQPLGCCSANRGFDAASGWGSIKVPAFARTAAAAAR